jgi:glycosyltransferase involved in cell wall biosynthesis
MSSVDVIVPCYRYGHFLQECVESVLAESTIKVRVLIIDDASPDNTAEVAAGLARKDPRVAFLRHTTNKGHIATYNEGIEWVSADYMLLLSADDYLLPGALSRSVNLMDSHPEVGFTFGNAIEISDNGTTSQIKSVHIADKAGWHIMGGLEFIELSKSKNIVPTPTAVVRTELQKRVGGYRPELPHSGDMEMWLRLAAHASVGILEANQAIYRRHGSNMDLIYYKEHCLPDLKQRKAALDCFFQTCSYTLPFAQKLRRTLYWHLSREAFRHASAAFNEGEMELSERLSDFALNVYPEAKISLRWMLLVGKRYLGFRAWRVFLPVEALIRKAASCLRHE